MKSKQHRRARQGTPAPKAGRIRHTQPPAAGRRNVRPSLLGALKEASAWINANKVAAAQTYIRVEKSTLPEVGIPSRALSRRTPSSTALRFCLIVASVICLEVFEPFQ
jgi:hypothetical protein